MYFYCIYTSLWATSLVFFPSFALGCQLSVQTCVWIIQGCRRLSVVRPPIIQSSWRLACTFLRHCITKLYRHFGCKLWQFWSEASKSWSIFLMFFGPFKVDTVFKLELNVHPRLYSGYSEIIVM